MSNPEINDENRVKPVSYDPKREKFIYLDEILKGEEKIIPVSNLSEADVKKLVIERHKSGPDYKVQSISGPPLSRDDVVNAIEKDQDFGLVTVQAEKSYLETFLKELQQKLD